MNTLTYTSGGKTYTATPTANTTGAQQQAALNSGWAVATSNGQGASASNPVSSTEYGTAAGPAVPTLDGHTVTVSQPETVGSSTSSSGTTPQTGEPGGSALSASTNTNPASPAQTGFQNPPGVTSIAPSSTPLQATNPGYAGAGTGANYNSAFDTLTSSGQEVPSSGGDARTAISAAMTGNDTVSGPITTAVNNAQQNYFQAQNQLTSYESSLQSITALQSTLETGAGIPQIQGNLMNIQNLMNGQQGDIENEIASGGGGASEGYVEGLTSVRNKVLSTQAAQLQNQLSLAQNQVQMDLSVQESDRQQAQQQLTDNITQSQSYLSFYQNLQTQATANYQKIISSSANGYSALVGSLGNDPGKLADAETFLNLAPGTLQNPQSVASLDAAQYKLQSLQATIARNAAQGGYYDARTIQSQVSAANSIMSNYTKLPVYTLLSNASPYLSRIEAAQTNPGSVSDTDLLDSLVKLETGGGQVTEAQVSTVLEGSSYADQINTIKNKAAAQGGVLSDSQRQQIETLADAIYAKYQENWQPYDSQLHDAFSSSGIDPSFMGMIPDLNALSTVGATGANANLSSYGQSVTIGGQQYTTGHPLQSDGLILTPNAQGYFTGSDGNNYTTDAQGNVIPYTQ